MRESVTWVVAEAALLWVAAGEPGRARPLLHQLAGPGFGGIPRDLDWLLTVVTLTEVAVAAGAADLAAAGRDLLLPYAGRGVVNGGAAAFAGVVSDYLHQATELAGPPAGGASGTGLWAARAASEYERLGATWWRDRLARGGAGAGHTSPDPAPAPAGPAPAGARAAAAGGAPAAWRGRRLVGRLPGHDHRRPGRERPALPADPDAVPG